MSEAAKVIEGDVEPKAKAVAKRKLEVVPANIDGMGVIERLVMSGASIETIERVIAMNERQEDRNAHVAFNAAMALAQSELVPVIKNRANSQTHSKYADIAAIAEVAMPVIHKHGFGLSFSEFKSEKEDHLGVACEVTHGGGCSKRYEFNVPIDGTGMKGNANKTATHAYGSSFQYGRRYATCGVFNIATKDDDGNAAGAAASNELVNEAQIDAISLKIKEVGANVEAFLKMGDVESIADIKASQYKRVMELLDMKKATKK